MSRFVTAKPSGLEARMESASGDPNPAKDYLERIGKYVPGEVIAAYTGLNALLANFPESIQYVSYIICFLICWIMTPIYFKLIANPEDQPSLKFQMIVSGIAFVIWTYAIDGGTGIFGEKAFDIYHQAVGGALLIIFSLISGAIIPKK